MPTKIIANEYTTDANSFQAGDLIINAYGTIFVVGFFTNRSTKSATVIKNGSQRYDLGTVLDFDIVDQPKRWYGTITIESTP